MGMPASGAELFSQKQGKREGPLFPKKIVLGFWVGFVFFAPTLQICDQIEARGWGSRFYGSSPVGSGLGLARF